MQQKPRRQILKTKINTQNTDKKTRQVAEVKKPHDEKKKKKKNARKKKKRHTIVN